ncbi:MAG: tetratricopeptide repeat protein [Deltaproteobacteria bacterium]|nr:tetratricopeptide repeat protein [Deltaproteobacteria bacterium]
MKKIINVFLKNEKTAYILLLSVLTFGIYLRSIGFDFVNFDDDINVYENPYLTKGFTKDGIIWAFTAQYYFWQPMVWLTYLIDFEFWGLNPKGYHLTNIIFHTINSVLVFHLFTRLTKELRASAFIAFVFALHPLHVESVVWITERKDVLFVFFWLLATTAYVKYTERKSLSSYLTVFTLFCLSLMSKPMAITFPFTLILLDLWPLNRFKGTEKPLKIIAEKIPLLIPLGITMYLTLTSKMVMETIQITDTMPFVTKISNIPVSYLTYVYKFLVPEGLTVFYPYTHNQAIVIIFASLVLLLCTIFACAVVRNKPFVAVGWFWFLGTLVPTIGLIQGGDHVLADRYMYIPLIGLSIVLTWGAKEFSKKFKIKNGYVAITAFLVIGALCITTFYQVGFWKDSMTLWNRTVELEPKAAVAYNNRGIIYERDNQYKLAFKDYKAALEIKPNYSNAHNNIGNMYSKKQKYSLALEHLSKAILIDSKYANAYNNRGLLFNKLGQTQRAVSDFSSAIEANPTHKDAYYNRGVVNEALGNLKDAISDYSSLIKLAPMKTEAYNNRGIAYAINGNLTKAISDFKVAIRVDPKDKAAYYNLSRAYSKLGQTELSQKYLALAQKLSK